SILVILILEETGTMPGMLHKPFILWLQLLRRMIGLLGLVKCIRSENSFSLYLISLIWIGTSTLNLMHVISDQLKLMLCVVILQRFVPNLDGSQNIHLNNLSMRWLSMIFRELK